METNDRAATRELYIPRCANHPRAEIRTGRVGLLRSWQDLAGSGRGHRGNCRFSGILRAGNAAPGGAAKTDADARRAELFGLHSAWRWRDYSAVEFPMRHHG